MTAARAPRNQALACQAAVWHPATGRYEQCTRTSRGYAAVGLLKRVPLCTQHCDAARRPGNVRRWTP